MPKKKTKKSAAKRFWKTGTGKIKFRKAGGGHLLTGKSRKRKRKMGQAAVVHAADQRRIGEML